MSNDIDLDNVGCAVNEYELRLEDQVRRLKALLLETVSYVSDADLFGRVCAELGVISVGVVASMTHRLTKWDGEPPENAEPIGHPQCIEVIEITNNVPRTIYQRES